MLAAFVKQYQKRLLKKKKLNKQAIKKTVARIQTATVARALTFENPVHARVLCTLMEVPGSLTFGFMIIIIIVKHGVIAAAECCQGKNLSPESVIKKTSPLYHSLPFAKCFKRVRPVRCKMCNTNTKINLYRRRHAAASARR